MCTTLEVSRSGFYAWLGRPESQRSRDDRRLTELIREEFEKGRKVYGSPRVHAALKARSETCGLNRVARLMREAEMRSKVKPKFKRTTNSLHNHAVAANLLNQDFSTNGPNEVWSSDITYIPTDEGWLYLASTMDLFSRMIVGWSMSSTMPASLVVDALNMAIDRRSPSSGMIHLLAVLTIRRKLVIVTVDGGCRFPRESGVGRHGRAGWPDRGVDYEGGRVGTARSCHTPSMWRGDQGR